MGQLIKRYDVIVSVLFFLIAIPLQHFEALAVLEEPILSLRHEARDATHEARARKFSNDIILINTDEAFFRAYKSFPLRRTDIAALVRNLKDLGAKVVAVDMLMDYPSSYNEDPGLAGTLLYAGNALLVAQAEFKDKVFVKVNRPAPLLDAAAPSAYTNITANTSWQTSMSRLTVYPEIAAEKTWPFSVAAVAMFLGVEPELKDHVLKFGQLEVPLDYHNRLAIDYPPMIDGYRFLSQTAGIGALDFLDISAADERDRQELSAWVKDKIVLVGDTSEVSHDWFDTPVGNVYGVEIIADTINTLLKGAPIRAVSPLIQAVILLLVLAAMAVPAMQKRPSHRGLSALLIFAGFIAIGFGLYAYRGVFFPMSYALVAGILSYLLIEYRYYMAERDQKRQIAKNFGQYIPAELVEEMVENGQEVSIGGESRELTVLFSDVRGFTTISEGLNPHDLTTLMNVFLSAMTKVIHENRGTIDKYMGDAIMAFWGAPIADPDHARHAVEAALAMDRAMPALAEDFVARGWKPIKVGIGLNTGTMTVGNMGSNFRAAYTVLGDAVNLGSRLESLTKQYGVHIIVSEFTKAAVPDLVCRELDLVRVKGKDLPVRMFEPLGFEAEIDAATHEALARYDEALALYRRQKWQAAQHAFQALAVEAPDRLVHRIYLDRIAHFLAEPPAPDWDGVFTHQSK